MTSIYQAVSGTIDLMRKGQEIYEKVAKAMDSAEKVAQSGADKKAWVLAYAKSFIVELGKNWEDWAKYISDFINSAKSIYNSVKGIL